MKAIQPAEYRTRLYEDLVVGEHFRSPWSRITEQQILAFSDAFDPQFFHADSEAAKTSRFGGLIASGAHTFALWNKINLEMNGDIAWIAGIGFEHFRFPNPLRAEIDFQARSELLAMRESGSDSTRGIVTHLYELWTSDEVPLFSAECIALVERRQGSPRIGGPSGAGFAAVRRQVTGPGQLTGCHWWRGSGWPRK